ncbi:hypothetical protein BpHYR1_026946 [Brachionus plicatilis]|uniref:Uncharacterized protein n=1 Tax=Brachionus plicatilis TaxID=10195 RepID=A0A3M7PUE4_BRAPC|nr:hypothetical protein BpHYR1_026946 [Brachionus plicatilis]
MINFGDLHPVLLFGISQSSSSEGSKHVLLNNMNFLPFLVVIIAAKCSFYRSRNIPLFRHRLKISRLVRLSLKEVNYCEERSDDANNQTHVY